MHKKLLKILACPGCHGQLDCTIEEEADSADKVVLGSLRCVACKKEYPIQNGIPRFVSSENYASSFGMQWNLFRLEQIDSASGKNLSKRRFHTETGWGMADLAGKWILDAGCGAGRFLDVVSQGDCEVIGVDISNAVDAVKKTLGDRKNLHLVQASIYELPFREGAFDLCYSIGVIQHTPDPPGAIRALPRTLKEGGRIGLTIYERKPWTPFCSKYLIRPITKRLPPQLLLAIIKCIMPILFPIMEVTFRIPFLGRLFAFIIPAANYVGHGGDLSAFLSLKERYRYSIMDTFDMLAPAFDQPQTMKEVGDALSESGITDLRRMTACGLSVEGRKGSGHG